MKKEFIAYQGKYFTIEWYFNDQGKSPALIYYEKLSKQQKIKLVYLFAMLTDTGQIKNKKKFRHEDDQIYAFKPIPDRFLCFFYEQAKIIITNAFEKKTDKIPSREKQKALVAKQDYILRQKKGSYYEED